MERKLDVIVIRTDVQFSADEKKAINTLLSIYKDKKGYEVKEFESKTIVFKTVKEG